MRGSGVVFAVVIAACAPVVDGPAEQARAADAADGDRLGAQLAALPGAWSAHATLHRAVRDPLSGETSPASAAVLVVIDDHTDRSATQRAAEALVHGAAPEIAAPIVLVEIGAPRPELAGVGPFRVAKASRTPLLATLAVCLLAIAALALALARAQRGKSAQ